MLHAQFGSHEMLILGLALRETLGDTGVSQLSWSSLTLVKRHNRLNKYLIIKICSMVQLMLPLRNNIFMKLTQFEWIESELK